MNLAIKLFNKVSVPVVSGSMVPDVSRSEMVRALNGEIAYFGYTLAPDILNALRDLPDDMITDFRDTLLSNLAEIKGADKTYTRLFNKFPYETPDQHDYMEQRVLGQMSNDLGIPLGGNIRTMLSCGHVIDSALFDIDAFGACPICQFAVPELSSPDDEARYDFQSVTPLTVINLSTDGFREEGNALMARPSSLSADEKTFLTDLVNNGVKLDFPTGIYKETLPFAFKIGGADAVKDSISGATDIMRIAYYVSDENADLSMKENVRFKLSTAHKRSLLTLLEGCKNLSEDMMRNRERWVRLGERLNPGSAKNAARYPKVAKAYDRLRNDSKGIVTFNKQVEESIRNHVIDQSLVDLMIERPGEYVRKLDLLLRETADTKVVLDGLRRVAPRLTERLMLDMRKYLATRNDQDKRIFIPKGKVNKLQVVNDKRKPLPVEAAIEAIMIMDEELMRRYGEKEAMGKVFIDDALGDILLPFNRRGDSSTASPEISKGSRYAFNGDYLRMFTWWKNGSAGRVDVDLSIVYFDNDFKESGQVSFTNLYDGDRNVVHSGDIQDAPKGASEFIDINVAKLVKKGIRYVAASVLSYTGQTFDQFECFAGFMERDGMQSRKVYQPESVRFRFDLNSKNTRTIPLVFDLVERKVIFADLASSGGRYGAVQNQTDKHKVLTQAVLSYPERKPTVFDVVFLNAMARGEIVTDREEADIVFDVGDAKRLIEEGVA